MEFESSDSHVMENASWLCDVFGPRSLKSSSYREAAEWTRGRLEEYGLSNAELGFNTGDLYLQERRGDFTETFVDACKVLL